MEFGVGSGVVSSNIATMLQEKENMGKIIESLNSSTDLYLEDNTVLTQQWEGDTATVFKKYSCLMNRYTKTAISATGIGRDMVDKYQKISAQINNNAAISAGGGK